MFDQEDLARAASSTIDKLSVPRPTGFGENLKTELDRFNNNDRFGARRKNMRDAYDKRIETIKQLTGKRLNTPFSRFGPDNSVGMALLGDVTDIYSDPDDADSMPGFVPYNLLGTAVGKIFDGVDNDLTEPQRLREHEAEIEAIRQSLPENQRVLIKTAQEIEDEINKSAQEREARAASMASRATLGGVFGQFIGGAAGSLSQEEVLITLPFGAPARFSLLGKILAEAAIAAGAETAIQPGVQSQRADYGLESGVGQAASNIAMAGGGAGVATGVIGVVGKIAAGGVRAFEEVAKRKATKDEIALIEKVTEDQIVNESPYEQKTPETDYAHAQNMRTANEAVTNGRLPEESEMIRPENVTLRKLPAIEQTVSVLRNADIKKIQVDAETMQFKAGGNAQGVTDRLEGVDRWENERAGMAMVYEYDDGTQIIADGHQRLALAKRAIDNGQRVEMPVIILREADGITPEQARARAALKNIAEGTGTSVDAAKVMRDLGVSARETGLPLRSSMVRDADGLANLSEGAFKLVTNERINPTYGAMIGKLIDDQGLHESIAGLVVRLKPKNAVEAESIIRQAAAAGATKETQQNLFGDEMVTNSLYLEKAKVLDRSKKLVRQNIDTFRTLDQRGDEIVAEGNVLDEARNMSRLEIENAANAYIAANAHSKGEISELLNKYAARAQKTGNYAAAARDFVKDVTSAIKDGRIKQGDILAGARTPMRADPSVNPVTDAQAALFDDPSGPGARAQTDLLEGEIDGDMLADQTQIYYDAEIDGSDVVRKQSVKEIIEEIEADQEFLEQLKACGGER